jgi:hypothetical protein
MGRTRVTWAECLLTGLFTFGLAGTGGLLVLIAGLILLIRPGTSLSEAFGFDREMVAFAAGSATLAGAVSWRLIVRTPDSRPRYGALAGLVVGFAAHPLCWFLILAYQTALDPSPRGQSAYNVLFNQVFMTLWMSVSSLGLVGWASMPLGAALGYLAKRILAGRSMDAAIAHH